MLQNGKAVNAKLIIWAYRMKGMVVHDTDVVSDLPTKTEITLILLGQPTDIIIIIINVYLKKKYKTQYKHFTWIKTVLY